MLSVSRSICCLCSLNLVLLLCSLGPDCSHVLHLLPIVPTPSQCIYTSISLTPAPDAPVSCIALCLNCGFLCLDVWIWIWILSLYWTNCLPDWTVYCHSASKPAVLALDSWIWNCSSVSYIHQSLTGSLLVHEFPCNPLQKPQLQV